MLVCYFAMLSFRNMRPPASLAGKAVIPEAPKTTPEVTAVTTTIEAGNTSSAVAPQLQVFAADPSPWAKHVGLLLFRLSGLNCSSILLD